MSKLEAYTHYEKTLFLNCCMGLLVAPQQWDQRVEHQISEEMNVMNWSIDTHPARPNLHKKGIDQYSVENFAYHLRNSFCHHLFSILGDSERINRIRILDYSDNERINCTFDLTVSIHDLKSFVIKYAKAKIALLKTNP